MSAELIIILLLAIGLILSHLWYIHDLEKITDKFVDKLVEQDRNAYDERRELHDRIMALTRPDAIAAVLATRDRDEGEVRYVDEEEGTSTSKERDHGQEA